MARGRVRNGVAVLVSLLALVIAAGQAFAGPIEGAPEDSPGVSWSLPDVEDRSLRSRMPGFRVLNGGESSLQVIIGSDERQQVTNTTTFPNSAVTYLEVWSDEHDFVFLCSAAFVGPNVLLTAAHCLWIPEFGGFPDGVAVAPGMNGDQAPFGIHFASDIWVPDEWIEEKGNINSAYGSDYGLIVLDGDELGSQVGSFSVGALPTDVLQAPDFHPSTAGYPGDKPLGTQWYGTSDTFASVRQNLLMHDIDAFQGQSGSAVWRGSDLTVVGVVSFETSRDNYARRITTGVLNDLNGACASLGCSINQTSGAQPTEPPVEPSPTATDEPSPTTTPEPAPTTPPEPSPTEPGAEPQGDLAAFGRVYQRTDRPVEAGAAHRTWIWGPALGEVTAEEYDEAADGRRAVLYHEKSRMEITDPGADPSSVWYVTNGLIAQELVTGRMQVGHDRFEERSPAGINVAGDGDDPNGVTYGSFLGLLDAAPAEPGSVVTATVDRAGAVGDDPALASHGVTAGYFAPETNHNVASVFWTFMNSAGTVYEDGAYLEDALFESPFFATGLPITEPYWTRVKVGGTERLVLVQVFERRALTYTPGNPPGWEVEAGNVGAHYHLWRYGS